MFKVGDNVYSPLRGFGVVKDIDRSDFPVKVKFSDGLFEHFSDYGKYFLGSPQPLLFHHEVEYVKVEPKFERGEWVQVSDYPCFSSDIVVKFGCIEDGKLKDTNGATWLYWKKFEGTRNE